MRKFNNKNIILSVVALLMIGVLAVGISFSWIEGGNKTYINSNEITITTGSNLTIRDHDGKITSELTFPVSDLYEVSSADGRSFFIPMDDNKTNAQASMTFRTGTPNDENKKYVSLDFQIEAGDSETHVYLGSGTLVKCADPDINKALRMAFYKNDGSAPTVFRPSQMAGTTDGIKYEPIVAIDNDGKVNGTTEVTTEAYGKYYFQGLGNSESIFDLSAGEVLNVTMVLWLEGTEINKAITEQDININIEFTTNSDNLIKYTFIDNCHNSGGYYDNDNDGDEEYVNNWVHHVSESKYETMMYIYDYVDNRYYLLSKQDNTTWMGYVSSSVSEFVFRRYSIYDDTYWNEWEPSIKDIPTITTTVDNTTVLERTFVAISGHPTVTSGANIRGCYGYWKDANDTIRIYFEMGCKWTDLHCYAETVDGTKPLGSWPGQNMHEVKNDANEHFKVNDNPVYYVDITSGSQLKEIEFNNGNSKGEIYLDNNFGYDNNGVYIWDYNNYDNGFLATESTEWSTWREQNYVTLTSNKGKEFRIKQYNKSTGAEIEAWNSGYAGRSYVLKEINNAWELKEFVLKIQDSQCFFNGSYFSHDFDGNTDYKVYTESYNSNIYPVNKSATD